MHGNFKNLIKLVSKGCKGFTKPLHCNCKEIFENVSEPKNKSNNGRDNNDNNNNNIKSIMTIFKNNSGSLQYIYWYRFNTCIPPNVYTVLNIGLTLPMSNASSESIFPKWK